MYLLGEKWFWTYEWSDSTQCLTMHDREWFRASYRELPESLIEKLRATLKQQGRFTFQDIVGATVELNRRQPLPPGLQDLEISNVPTDLGDAGLFVTYLRSREILLYASLTPKQLAKATSEEGLAYGEMNEAQRALIAPEACFHGGWNHDSHPLPEGELAKGVFRVKQSVQKGHDGKRYEAHSLVLDFPSKRAEGGVWLPLAKVGEKGAGDKSH